MNNEMRYSVSNRGDYMKKEYIEQLKKGDVISNSDLTEIFNCSPRGGMRRSLKTNSLVLLSFKGKKPYNDVVNENGIWKYTGMGRNGNQLLEYMQNKTLLNSNQNGVNVYLFTVEDSKYHFIDRVLLAGYPEIEIQEGENGKKREALVFPLIEIGNHKDIKDFLLSSPLDELLNKEQIIRYPQFELSRNSVEPLSNYMKKNNIDTLTGQGGWFFTKDMFFNNPNTQSKYKNGYINDITTKDKNVSKAIVFDGQNKFLNPYYRSKNLFEISEGSTFQNSEKNHYDQYEKKFLLHRVEYSYFDNEKITIMFNDGDFINNISSPFVSVIIGPNGTGKSTVLGNIQRIILDAFNYSNSKKSLNNDKLEYYKIVYQIGIDIFEIEQIQEKGRSNRAVLVDKLFYKNGNDITYHELQIPNKMLAIAFSIDDKFTFDQKLVTDNKRYNYLGIKSSDKIARVGEISKTLVYNILNSSQKENFNFNLKLITNFIDVEPVFRIKYNFKKENLFNELTKENIVKRQNKLRTQAKKVRSNLNFIEYNEIIDFFDRLKGDLYDSEVFKYSDKGVSIDFDFSTESTYNKYYEEFYTLWHLYEIGILEKPIIYLKKDKFYKLEDASSGESQYITTLVNILTQIEKGTLVLIDEPETSLHPNWQYKYMHGIREIFQKYNSCHFIIATHSHFLLSDLEPRSSSITSIRRSQSGIETFLHDENTFGWSPDDILYNIFNMKTSRNFYLEEDLRKLLFYISKKRFDKLDEINTIFEKLNKLTLKPNDPLNQIIENAREFIRTC